MEFKTEIVGDRGIVTVSADLDNEMAGEALSAAVDKVIERGKLTVVLDMSSVAIMNSYGLGKIIMCHKKVREADGVLMVRSLTGFMRDAFSALLLDTIIPCEGQEVSSGEPPSAS